MGTSSASATTLVEPNDVSHSINPTPTNFFMIDLIAPRLFVVHYSRLACRPFDRNGSRYAHRYTTTLSGSAECLVDALARLRGIGVGLESFLGPVRLRQHGRQLGKGLEILALAARIYGLFVSMIACSSFRVY